MQRDSGGPPRFWRRHREPVVLRRRIRRAALLLLVPLAGAALCFADAGIVSLGMRGLEIRRLERVVARLEVREAALQRSLQLRRNDRETLERLARERYGMAYPGETVYRIVEVDGATGKRIEREQRRLARQSPAPEAGSPPRSPRANSTTAPP